MDSRLSFVSFQLNFKFPHVQELSSIAKSTTLAELTIEEGFKHIGVRGLLLGIDIRSITIYFSFFPQLLMYLTAVGYTPSVINTTAPRILSWPPYFHAFLTFWHSPSILSSCSMDPLGQEISAESLFVVTTTGWRATSNGWSLLLVFSGLWYVSSTLFYRQILIVALGSWRGRSRALSDVQSRADWRRHHRRLWCSHLWHGHHHTNVSYILVPFTPFLRWQIDRGEDFATTGSIKVYNIEDVVNVGLSQPALILIAMLVGGDYNVSDSWTLVTIETKQPLAWDWTLRH